MTTTEIRDCWMLDRDKRCPYMPCCQLCPLAEAVYWRNVKRQTTGVLRLAGPNGSVDLSVADGIVVGCLPEAVDMVKAAGGSARTLLDEAKAKGAAWEWIPDRKATT